MIYLKRRQFLTGLTLGAGAFLLTPLINRWVREAQGQTKKTQRLILFTQGNGEPVVIPIFGRGRSYYALVGDQIGEPAITENCRFLAGPCSCQVKRDNPGVDLLFAADWEARVLGSAAPERPAPPLAALGQLRPPSIEPLAVAAQKPLADPVERLAADARDAPSLIGWAIGLAATGTVASVAFAGLVMGMRRKRKR